MSGNNPVKYVDPDGRMTTENDMPQLDTSYNEGQKVFPTPNILSAFDAALKYLGAGYGSGKGQFNCDMLVEQSLTDSGYDSLNYLPLGTQNATVENNINQIQTNDNVIQGEKGTNITLSEGEYVVLMGGSGDTGHAGILDVSENETQFIHSTGSETVKGVQIDQGVTNSSSIQQTYLYKDYYYIPIVE